MPWMETCSARGTSGGRASKGRIRCRTIPGQRRAGAQNRPDRAQAEVLFPGRTGGFSLLSAKGPGQGHGGFAGRQGSYHHAGRGRRVCGRRGAGCRGRNAVVHGHGHHRLHRAQDQAGRDDPRDARGACFLRHVSEVSAGAQHAHPGRPGGSAFQLQRKAAGADICC